MAITRQFLGWGGPCLHLAARWLDERYGCSDSCDLERVMVVVPGRRSQRRLLEVLVTHTQGRLLTPPRIVTLGELPEQLYTPQHPVADPLTALLARVQVLRDADPAMLAAIVPSPPAHDDLQAWVMLARDLAGVDADLAAGAVPIDEVVARCQAKTDFTDHERWQALVGLHEAYERALAHHGVQDHHATRAEVVKDNRCHSVHDIVLLATADMHEITRRMLGQLDATITALVYAPDDHAADFDALGCLTVGRWTDRRLDLDPQMVRVVDHPRDQACEVLQVLSGLAERALAVDQVTVGMGDEAMGPMIERTLELAGVPARQAVGRPIAQSRPAMLLSGVARLLASEEGPRLDDFAALLRHPDLEACFTQPAETDTPAGRPPPHTPTELQAGISSWITLLDRYAADHLQSHLMQPWPGDPTTATPVQYIRDRLMSLLPRDPYAHRPLPHWSHELAQTLIAIYSHINLSRHKPDQSHLAHALEAIGQTLREQSRLSPDAAVTPKLTAAQAITLTLSRLDDQETPPEGGEPAVELLGWLELLLDDAPALVVTGVNEGQIPRSRNADAWLPDHVRAALGLEDNARRYARDMMMLTAIVVSRKHVTLIAGRRGSQGDPLTPSRLLLACDPEVLPQRVLRFFPRAGDDHHDRLSPALPPLVAPGATSRLTVPLPQPRDPITSLSVTAFRDYLACPYRFYLKHVLKLRAVERYTGEMDALVFGTLIHEVLGRFGVGDMADSTDPVAIERYLLEQLSGIVRGRFGEHPQPAVRVQYEQARRRLSSFAAWQAEQAKLGWRIVAQHVEKKIETQLDVDGKPFTVTGKIDRIDRHDEHGYRILDYKTSESAKTPEENHRRGKKGQKQWIDLQLPLYVELAATAGIPRDAELGYIQIPKDAARLNRAGWSKEEIESAIEVARGVIRMLRSNRPEVFWPPAEKLRYTTDYDAICMEGFTDRAHALAASEKLLRECGGAS